MADESVKLDLVATDELEKGLLADGLGARVGRRDGDLAALRADDGDLPVALDRVGQADAGFDYGPAAVRLEVDAELIFNDTGGFADFVRAEDPIESRCQPFSQS